MQEDITKAVHILNQGGIIIFPTDTAFGIGCRMDDEKAIKRLFEIRRRPQTQAIPVLVDSREMAQEYVQPIPQDVIEQLIQPYWPGALTLVLPCKTEKVPELVRGGGQNLGVRMPGHLVALEVIKKVGIPVLAPSANFHAEKTPFTVEELDKNLVRLVDFVLPGDCMFRQTSTVIDCSVKPWKVLRQGVVSV